MFKFRQPYLDADNGTNLSGGGAPADPTGQQVDPPQSAGNQQDPAPFLTVKYNKNEVPLDKDRAIEFAQKGMNYDHVYSELDQFRNHPGLSWLNNQAQRYGMSVERLIEAYQQQEEQEQLNQLVQQNIPQEYAQEMLENRRFRQQYQAEREANQQKIKVEKMYEEFLSAYPDTKGEDIPSEVWREVEQGKNLLDAYIKHENKLLRGQLQVVQTKEQAAAANQANAQASTGSAKGQGIPDSGFISKEVYEANKESQEWMLKNYDQIKKSMGKWR